MRALNTGANLSNLIEEPNVKIKTFVSNPCNHFHRTSPNCLFRCRINTIFICFIWYTVCFELTTQYFQEHFQAYNGEEWCYQQ
jgi:hypothetical protein